MTMPGTGPFSGRVLGTGPALQLIKLFDLSGSGEIGKKKNKIFVN